MPTVSGWVSTNSNLFPCSTDPETKRNTSCSSGSFFYVNPVAGFVFRHTLAKWIVRPNFVTMLRPIPFFLKILFIQVSLCGIICSCTSTSGKNEQGKQAAVQAEAGFADSVMVRESGLTVAQMDASRKEVQNVKPLLSDAMLVMRSDNDYESLTLQNFSKRERVYSHAGILFREGEEFMVYHSMTGLENPSGTIRRDPFDSFVNPSQKTGFGLFQYRLHAGESRQLHALLKKGFEEKTPFDIFFNLRSDDSLYCSEMIYKNLIKATAGRVVLPFSYILDFHPKIMGYKHNNVRFKRFEYIGLDDLYLNPFCREVKRVAYLANP